MIDLNDAGPGPELRTGRTIVAAAGTWLRRFGFRFVAIYLFLFNLPLIQIDFFPPSWYQTAYAKLWKAIVPWIASHVLGMKGAYTNRSFVEDDSDSWFAWIRWGCYLALALLGALIWVWFDVRRRHDRIVHELVRIYVRYSLVAVMLGYGFVKVFLRQFPHDELGWLGYRVGELSPFMLMWTFMGYSNAYQAFAGVLEVVGGVLLLFRRTTTLGALVVAGIMTNVVALNLSFDINVKLNAINFLAFALYLTVPDWGRLTNLFVLNRPTGAAPEVRWWPAAWPRWLPGGVKVMVVGFMLYAFVLPPARQQWTSRQEPRSEFYGLYTVKSFVRNRQDVPPLLTDTNRWAEVLFQRDGDITGLRMDREPLFSFKADRIVHEKLDQVHGTLTIRPRPKRADAGSGTNWPPIILAYSWPAPDELLLEGMWEGADLAVRLRRLNEKDLPLLKRRFRWVGR